MEAYEIHYEYNGRRCHRTLLISKNEEVETALARVDSNYNPTRNSCRMISQSTIPLTSLNMKDLTVGEVIQLMAYLKQDVDIFVGN